VAEYGGIPSAMAGSVNGVKYIQQDYGFRRTVDKVNIANWENRIHKILDIDQWIGTDEERSKLPDPLLLPKKVP
jgi:hypothetical protein